MVLYNASGNYLVALNEIESLEFDVRLNVVSSYRLFLTAAQQEPAVKALYQAMQSSEEVTGEVFGRVCQLSTMEIDTRYGNSKDAALTVLLWLLWLTEKAYAEVAAHYVAGAGNCWYAWRMARTILFPASVTANGSRLSLTAEKTGSVSTSTTQKLTFLNPFTVKSGKICPKRVIESETTIITERWTVPAEEDIENSMGRPVSKLGTGHRYEPTIVA